MLHLIRTFWGSQIRKSLGRKLVHVDVLKSYFLQYIARHLTNREEEDVGDQTEERKPGNVVHELGFEAFRRNYTVTRVSKKSLNFIKNMFFPSFLETVFPIEKLIHLYLFL